MKSSPKVNSFAESRDYYHPSRILIDHDLVSHPYATRLISYYEGTPIVYHDPHHEAPVVKSSYSESLSSDAIQTLHVTRNQGRLFKPCPGMADYICCNYFVINFIENCPLQCSYCFMMNYLTNPVLRVNANIEHAFQQIESYQQRHPHRLVRVGTGEISDSLFLEDALLSHREFFPFFANRTNCILELKTKTDCIEWLRAYHEYGHEAAPNIMFSWSVNPQQLIGAEEYNTATLTNRIEAAATVTHLGYPIALHFDPIIITPDWKMLYQSVIDLIFSRIPSTHVIYISLGLLRFNPGLKEQHRARFPASRLMTGELFPMADGKIRYFYEQRRSVFRYLFHALQNVDPQMVVYMCMETEDMWKHTRGFIPKPGVRIDDQFKRRLADWIPIWNAT
jgi:spore photoproduct lyase